MHLRICCFLTLASTSVATTIDIPNTGFEDRLAGWSTTNDNMMTSVVREAAFSGELGVRVTDLDNEAGSSLASKHFAASPGATYSLSFRGCVREFDSISVYIQFLDANRRILNRADKDNEIFVRLKSDANKWRAYTVKGVAPNDARFGRIWVRVGGYRAAVVGEGNRHQEPESRSGSADHAG